MTYYNKDYFLGSPAGFDGTFTLLDGELVYVVPSGKQGTVNVSIQYREDDGTALVDESGNPLPSFADTISVAGTPAGANDVLELAIPNGQLVSSTTFTVEVISENYDSSAVVAPQVDGVAMTQSQLQYPGTSTNSVQVWALDVTLTADQLNTLTITGGPSSISLDVTHSGDLTSAFVTSAAQARTALEDSANDEVVFNYAEADLISNVLSAVTWPTAKSSYTTVRAGTGSLTLPNDTADGTTGYTVSLPVDYLLCIQGAAIGSATDDGGGGTMVLDGSQAGVWFDQCTFTQKYNSTAYPNAVDVPYSASIAVANTNHTSYPKTKTSGRDCIFTACTWTNFAYKSVSVRDILIRDCTLEGIRGDFNNNGRVILNNRVINPCSIWSPGGSDKTHMDMYQASTQTANAADGSIMIGTLVHTDAFATGYQGQAILLSGSNAAETSVDGLIIDTMEFTGNRTDSAQLSQLAQGLTNARLSGINLFGQDISVRRDMASPFAPGPNVYFNDLTSAAFKYTPTSGSTQVFDADGTNVASTWGGAINTDKQAGESDVSVTTATVDNPTPTGATYFGGPTTDTALIYQSVLSNVGANQGQLDVSVLPAAFADVIRFNVRNANGNTPQMRVYFNDTTERDAFLATVTDVDMSIAGFNYSFAASGWSNVGSGPVLVCAPTGDAWPTATSSGGLWGDGDEGDGNQIEFTMAQVSDVDGGLAPDAWTPFVATDFGNSGVTGGITSADERYYVRPTARFMTQPIVEHGSSSREVKVIAHPYNGIDTDETAIGIDRVDFYVNGGAAQSVTTPATETGPTGEDELVYTFSVPGNLSQDLSSVRAVVYPNKGRIRVLQGTQYYKASDAEAFFGKYSRDEDFYSLEVDSSDILLNASEPYQWTCTSDVDNVGVSQGTDFDMSEIQIIYGTHDPASSDDVVKFTFTTEAGRDSWIENYNTTLYDQDLPTPNVTYVLADNGSNEWTITWTNGYASDVAASFYNDYDVLNSEQTFTLGWNPPESYSGGYWSAERGVLMQTPQATYHISPTGDDSTGDGSVGNPYETALGAYEAAGNTSSNYIIDNTAYSSQNGALNFSDFMAQWPGRSGWTGNTPVPIVKGGTVIGVPKSSSTSLQSVGSIPTDEEVPLGFIMDGVDIRPHASTYSGSDDLAATSYSLSGGGTDEMNCLRIMLTGCDIGPESLSDLEAQIAAPTGLFSSAFGIYLEMKGCGDSSPIWSDGNVIRYSHYKRLQESVNDKYIGQGAADIGNSNLQALNHIKDVNAWLYPWGPVGEATFCLKGQFDSMATKTVVNGIDNTSVVDASDAFYDLLGPTSVQGNFIPNTSYLTDNGNGTYTLIASGIDQTLADAWNDIAEANNCLIPPVVYDNAKVGTAPYVRRTTIDVSAITDPANWSGLTGTPNYSGFFQSGTDITGVTDPHLDIQQSFWNSQFRVPGLNEALKDKQYLGNTIAANIKIEGETNVFQGIFHSDASAIIESGFWNLEWEKDTSNDTSLLSLQWGHPGQEYGGPGVHVGPNLTRPSGDIFRVRPFFQQAEIPAGQITIYDIEGQRFVEGGGSIADQFSDWPALVPPETNEVVMTGTEAGAAAPVYYWSNTTSDPLVSLGSMSFTYSGSGTNSLSYTEVTDDSGVSGVYAAQGRYGASTFDGQVIIGTTLKLGPGYSNSGSSLLGGGIYDTPTYAYTGNDTPKTLDWINALYPGGISVVVTVDRSGEQFQGFTTMSAIASDNQGGYVNLSLSKLGNFIASYQAGDVVTVECFILPSPSNPSAQFTGTWDASGTTVTNLTAVPDSGDLLDDLTATGSSADKFFANSNGGGGLRLQDVSPYVPNSTTTLEVVAALTSAPGTMVTGSPLLYSAPQGSNNQKFLYLTASSFVDVASLAGISDGDSITLTVTRTVE